MRIPRSVIAASVLAATTITVAAAGPAPARAAGLAGGLSPATTTLPNSAAPFAASTRATGDVPAASSLTIQFWLAPRTAAAEGYATAASTPGSPFFRHFLSPAGYTARFGATQTAASGVESWLKSAGFTAVTTDSGRDYVQATAPASTIDTALRVQLQYYRATSEVNAGAHPLRANDRPVSLPASIAGSVLGVTGLDNAAPTQTYVKLSDPAVSAPPVTKPVAFPCSSWYLQHEATGMPRLYGATKFPTVICGYTPQQLRQAYGYSPASTGKGVTVALVEVGLTSRMFPTLQTYAQVHGIQAPSKQRYTELSLGQGPACGDPFNVEEQMDVEASYVMAPLAKQLVVGGDSCDNGFAGMQALFDADLKVLDGAHGRPLAQVVSNSWEDSWQGSTNEVVPGIMLAIEHAYLTRAAAEGVSMLFSSGDTSGVESPASDPYATAVGGTTLAIGHGNPRLFETGWSTGVSAYNKTRKKWVFQGEQSAAGGGASLLWQQPAYQHGVVPSALATAPGNRSGLVRVVPDISADADAFTGMAVGQFSFDTAGNPSGYSEQAVGGTSLATPLIAGLVADAEQGQQAFGFLNPALYRLAGSAAYHDAKPLSAKTPSRYRGVTCDQAMCGVLTLTTFDDQSGKMTGYTGQVTAPGYDTMTGLGTPNGPAFISGLRGR